MALPPKILVALQRATCDQIALDRKALRLYRSFQEAKKALEKAKSKK